MLTLMIAKNCEYDEKESIRRREVFSNPKDKKALKKARLLSHTYDYWIIVNNIKAKDFLR